MSYTTVDLFTIDLDQVMENHFNVKLKQAA